MTGSADYGPDRRKHIRSKEARRKLANRFKDAKDPFRIVIVHDMWLTLTSTRPVCTRCMPTSRCRASAPATECPPGLQD
jgi:hypothetical protein